MKIQKQMMMAMVAAALALAAVPAAKAYTWGPISSQEAAQWGGNYLFTWTHNDLTNTTTNATQTFTLPVVSNSSVELAVFVLDEACDSGDTNYTGSTLLHIGDGTDADLYLTSTELNVDGTEIWFKLPPVNSNTVTLTLQTGVHTNDARAVVTNATLTVAEALLGGKVYTVDDTVDVVFTPNAEESVSALSNGAGRAYFRIRQRF
jgi:hypothetical protein